MAEHCLTLVPEIEMTKLHIKAKGGWVESGGPKALDSRSLPIRSPP